MIELCWMPVTGYRLPVTGYREPGNWERLNQPNIHLTHSKIFEYVSEGHKPILGLAVGTCGIGFSHEEIIRGPAGRGGEDQQRSAVVMYFHSCNDRTSSMLDASYRLPGSSQLVTSNCSIVRCIYVMVLLMCARRLSDYKLRRAFICLSPATGNR